MGHLKNLLAQLFFNISDPDQCSPIPTPTSHKKAGSSLSSLLLFDINFIE
jgi:hypothetical protein